MYVLLYDTLRVIQTARYQVREYDTGMISVLLMHHMYQYPESEVRAKS